MTESAIIDNAPAAPNNTRLFAPGARRDRSGAIQKPTEEFIVANIKSAGKRARQAEKTRLHKMGLRSRMRTHIKNVISAVEAGDKEAAATAYKSAVPVIDSMINKGVVKKNKAARHKSRLNKMVKALA